MVAKKPNVTGRLIEVFGNTWTVIQRRHPDVPNVMITIGSGTERKGQTRWGHFQADAWEQLEAGAVAELFVGGEGLRRGGRDVLATLLHEAAHGVAHTRQIQDTSRGGRYHNRRFRALAVELGLDVTQKGSLGLAATTVPDHTAMVYTRQLDAIGKALVAWRRAHVHPDRTTGSGNLLVANCDCPRKIRVARSTLDEAPITCGGCDSDFTTYTPPVA